MEGLRVSLELTLGFRTGFVSVRLHGIQIDMMVIRRYTCGISFGRGVFVRFSLFVNFVLLVSSWRYSCADAFVQLLAEAKFKRVGDAYRSLRELL